MDSTIITNISQHTPQSTEKLQQEELFKNVNFKTVTDLIKNHQSNINILKKVKYTMSTNSDILSFYPNLIEAKDNVCKYINQLNDLYGQTKKHFVECILKIGEALKNYGVMTENSEIISEASVKENQLLEMNDHALLEKGFRIFRYAKSYIQSLYAFDNLKTIVNECYACTDEGIESEQINQNEKSAINVYRKTFIDAKEYLTNHVDSIFGEIREKHPAFYFEYRKARLVSSLSANNNSNNFDWVV